MNIDDGSVHAFDLDGASGEEFENKVFLDNVLIGCGDRELFMYDRSVVMGPIPFWVIHLLEDTMTFVIQSEPICAEETEERCSRFPIVLNGDSRKVLKIRDNNEIAIYDGNDNKWNVYEPSEHSHIDLSEVAARGVSETYGRSGHRLGAVESLLNIFTDGVTCIAKVFKNGTHSFYCIELDDDNKRYRILPASSCRLPQHIQQRFYAACTSSQFVFICSKGIAFVPLRPSSLRELSFLALQLQHCKLIDGVWSGGISEQQIKDLCSCKYQRALV
ncbi:hypothetical protein Tcan_11785 [Toxocara canis]|nr:hypothetical protein Tcan_11785 [Toxocara canis]